MDKDKNPGEKSLFASLRHRAANAIGNKYPGLA